jgi:hypothetical protein
MIHRDQHAQRTQVSLLRNVIAWFRRNGFRARLHDAISSHIPVGYEDEAGFHVVRETASARSIPDSDREIAHF